MWRPAGAGTRASAASAASAAASRSPPRGDRVVAVKGDPDSPVNRGLLCVKGYANAQILYGEDRLTRPLLRMKDGKFDKQRRLRAGDLGAGLRRDGAPVQARPRRARPDRRRHHGLRPVHHPGGLRGGQAGQGRLALEQPRPQRAALHGLGGGRLHPDLRHRRAVGQLRRHRAHRHGGGLGRQHGRDAPDALGPGHRPAAGRPRLPGGQPDDLRQPQLGHRRPRDRLQAAAPTWRSGTTSPARSSSAARSTRSSSSSTASSPPGPTTSATACAATTSSPSPREKDTQAREREVVLDRGRGDRPAARSRGDPPGRAGERRRAPASTG